ncbi:MAG: hypothetical protein H3C43_01430 [Leptonema sp. (in: Bacteria)]|nr:hypothetical protein [Leptonema sp. (in: bacteria)]
MILSSTINKRNIFLYLGLIVLFLTLSLTLNQIQVSNFIYTGYLFNYENEFVKRGFIGEIIRLSGKPASFELVTQIGAISLILTTIVFFSISFYGFRNNLTETGAVLFILTLLTSSATLQHFYLEIGRFDVFNFFLALLCIWISFRVKSNIKYILILTLCSISILIHEAAFLMYIPMVMGFVLYNTTTKKQIFYLISTCLLLVTLTWAVSTLGMVKKQNFEQHYLELISQYSNGHIDKGSVAVLHVTDWSKEMTASLMLLLNSESIVEHKRLLLYLGFFVLLFSIITLQDFKQNAFNRKHLILIFAISPLTLYPFGIDYYRWWSLAINNLLVSAALLSMYNTSFKQNLIQIFYRNQVLIILLAITSALNGPIGVNMAFQRF